MFMILCILFIPLFRGDSLSSSHFFTHSLTQSLTHSLRFYQIRRNIQSFQWNTIHTNPYRHKPIPYQPIPPHTIPYHPMLPHTTPYHLYVSNLVNNCIITSYNDSYHPIPSHPIPSNVTIYHYNNIPYNFITIFTKNTMNL